MRDAIAQGAIAVRSNPLRSALGALAIAVAVATIVIVITALDGIRSAHPDLPGGAAKQPGAPN